MLELVIIVFIPDRDQNRDRKVLTEDQEDQLIPSKAEIGDTLHYSQPAIWHNCSVFLHILNVKTQLGFV